MIFILNIILLIWSIISNIRIKNIHNKDKNFMEKLGDGKNIKEDLEKYMTRVSTTEEEIRKLSVYYKDLDKKTKKCLQKIGIVRYNAYKDTGSDLSFAVCLLDEKNNGVVFNGIYSRDMSNIYAKPIENGTSKYKITPEEQEAINRAIEY
jgi:hypothetical protein